MNEAPIRDGRRCAAWLSTLLLCVMLAATGLPRAEANTITVPPIALGEDLRGPRARHGAVAADTAVLTKGSVVAAATTMLPRAVPRARTIQAGGLPPPRAPTA